MPAAKAAPVEGLAARRAALRLLDAVLRRGESLDQAMSGAVKGIGRGDDRALVLAIISETLRRLPDLDALIDSATQRPLPDDAKARSVLRIALVQALVLGTPQHAAISTALPLVVGGPRRLVHGVFGTLMRKQAKLPDVPALPQTVADRWQAAWGPEMVEAAARAIAAPPPLDLTLKQGEDAASWADRLGGQTLAPNHVRLPRGSELTSLPGFDEGQWWVQDIAASLPARLMGDGAGRPVLDLCAAPGGKTMQLAAAGWDVTALDQSAKRLGRLSENLARTGLTATMVTADALDFTPDRAFDAVLLDAPCTATGIFRRHPDVLHRIGARDIAERAELQAALLDRAAQAVKPGGVLVYAVCSLEPEEGEEQARAFLSRHAGFITDAIGSDELPDGIAAGEHGWLRTLPTMLADQGRMDGFFVARFRRTD
ncbi:RsmB/NOP family class I SAM-dependent RNA methyltransferase [Novosphingopyxis baekryungensis]|uniref:RsmB/NOP family class I SAM-dependent RNA methyltransferase n=1 Tax=Novosphingopyxis baekryungensis TaxID=279369 RepID=UPI000409049D|nr:RsmB/NOP family class I SAM-dependent RNA methyltransferase [Novosphingopyxis baekryungensis]